MLFSVFGVPGKVEFVNFTAFKKEKSMNAGKIIIMIIMVAALLSSCKKQNNFTVSGTITHAEGKTIYFEKLGLSSSILLDSAKINKKGEFKFQNVTSSPAFYILKFSENNFITLLIDSVEQVYVTADAANFSREYNVQGSLGSIQVKELNDYLNSTRKKLDSLESVGNMYAGVSNTDQVHQDLNEKYNKIVEDQVEFSTQFVMNNPFSMASILALYQKFDQQNYIIRDLQTMRVAASALNSIYPESEHVKALYKNTVQLMQQEKNEKLKKIIDENGQNSPDILLPDPQGKEIPLSSLRGKVVLVQFWSALDKNSRIFNEALVEAYRKYKNKGFEIYQISVDNNRIEWVDAIDKDQLSWINVGDMNGSNQAVHAYNIQTVPANYLLNGEGVIVGKNLKGPALDKAVSEAVKK